MSNKICYNCYQSKPELAFRYRPARGKRLNICVTCESKREKTRRVRKMAAEDANADYVKRRRMAEEIEFNRQNKDEFPLDY